MTFVDKRIYGKLIKGCKFCLKGQIIPIFNSFFCNKRCFYCNMLPQFVNRDIVLVNGKEVSSINEVATLTERYKAVSIGGGEPLIKFERLKKLIYIIKKSDPVKNIHVYTNGILLTKKRIKELERSGLDEIRVHSLDLNVFRLLTNSKLSVCAEIPVEPNSTDKYISFVKNLAKIGIHHVNFNEIQSSSLSEKNILQKGFKIKDNKVVGSEETCFEILKKVKELDIKMNVHYCSLDQEINNAKKRGKNEIYS